MTREEAIPELNTFKIGAKSARGKDALDIAIKALEQIDKIKEIIAIDNMVIQEDVLKYKMICEVLK